MQQHSDATGSVFARIANTLENDWRFIARPNQLAPLGNWRIWLFCAGRGAGKTRSGAEWVKEQVETGAAKRIALVGPTSASARDVMVEGESGLLAISSPYMRPEYEPSKTRLTWPNGAVGSVFSSEEPERLRGPQFDAAWLDEVAAWANVQATWDMLQFGLRLGSDPRLVATTTPKPIPLIKDLISRDGRDVVVTRGSTHENAANLAPQFLETILSKYAGTRLGRQEIDAEMLEDVQGALWKRADIDATRMKPAEMPYLRRVVVAIDPAVSTSEGSDETGIVVAGVCDNRRAYIIEDRSGKYSPEQWASVAIELYRKHRADRVVAEVNQGGEMVENTLRMVDPNVSYRAVHASRGKATRAEPIAALYEQKRVHHVGAFPELEDQLCEFTADFDRRRAGYSPDRVDALVWALTDLMVQATPGYGILEYYRREVEKLGLNGAGPDLGYQLSGSRPVTATIKLRAPGGISTVYGMSGRAYLVGADGIVMVTVEDAKPLTPQDGWVRVEQEVPA